MQNRLRVRVCIVGAQFREWKCSLWGSRVSNDVTGTTEGAGLGIDERHDAVADGNVGCN